MRLDPTRRHERWETRLCAPHTSLLRRSRRCGGCIRRLADPRRDPVALGSVHPLPTPHRRRCPGQGRAHRHRLAASVANGLGVRVLPTSQPGGYADGQRTLVLRVVRRRLDVCSGRRGDEGHVAVHVHRATVLARAGRRPHGDLAAPA